jgi:hypothetical protein
MAVHMSRAAGFGRCRRSSLVAMAADGRAELSVYDVRALLPRSSALGSPFADDAPAPPCLVATPAAEQNEDAEEVMRAVDAEETALMASDAAAQPSHLAIINLVIGTLYCSKARAGLCGLLRAWAV